MPIVYPNEFLTRPCDRRFIALMQDRGVDVYRSGWMLYRIWADFATAQEPKRKVGEVGSQSLPTEYRILESFVEWDGEPGLVVRSALESGVLALEQDVSGQVLVATGYEEANRSLASRMRSSGGYAAAAKKHARSSRAEVERARSEHGDRPPPIDVTPEIRFRANELGVNIWRALNLKTEQRPDLAPDLPESLFVLAAELVESRSGERIQKVLHWLIASRNHPDVPKRIDMVLKEWAVWEQRAES